ncbi:histidine phosphatase family protein [Lujinxingia vulgaris]|uniref:Histidine phosphatase family protein n=1 Tax=Lujinxingia vulgaris TaxID=2600176 RepID=A0A5C6XQ42_9DELT|nr:histidine phosphatase family protein [Lujinxingia vulgaris]TXD39509.1 histidine phosphatase family protein [Lujinxingia vulgaris]
MSDVDWRIPPSVLRLIESAPEDRAVVILLRHSVRDELPLGDVGYDLPITDIGHQLAFELGGLFRGRLRTLHASPLVRCVKTAEALAKGADAAITVVCDPLLGDPGVFVVDGRRAWTNWEELGHEGVMRHLVTETSALPGMARPDEAARFLVQSMLSAAADEPGVHVFVTHDSLITATAARLLGRKLGAADWPWYLEGAFFWETHEGINTAYRDDEAVHIGSLCGLTESDVIEFARREVAATIGLDSGARFFLAGGAFKSLITGRPPRDLDVWAPSARDRGLIIESLLARGARHTNPSAFSDVFELAGRVVEVPYKTEPETLSERLARFDIGLSAVGVEHRPYDRWSAIITA